MRVIKVRNVHNALWEGMLLLAREGAVKESRAGQTLSYPTPVTTLYRRPTERVILWPTRNANPFFHLFESLWMLGGRNDVAWLEQFNSNMRQFSDDGEIFRGAYGYRWRTHFAVDQLRAVSAELAASPESRRVVLGMWDPNEDLGAQSVDVPCNLNVVFSRRRDARQLDMTVFCRSNDIIWGAYGANAVHFSVLQEFLAATLGITVGQYWQVSVDFHAYVEIFQGMTGILTCDDVTNPYSPWASHRVEPFPLILGVHQVEPWLSDLEMFLTEGLSLGFQTQFFRRVAIPMLEAWQVHKDGETKAALDIIKNCAASDWRVACEIWLETRLRAKDPFG